MPRFRTTGAALTVAGLVLAAAGYAQAQGAELADDEPRQEHEARHVRVELLGGMGFGNVHLSTGESLNTYGPGVSIRAGYRFSFGGFAGLRFDHFFGATTQYAWSGVARTRYGTSASIAALELGYELLLPHAFVRPHVALGAGFLGRDAECKPAEGSFSALGEQHCAQVQQAESGRRSWGFAAVPGLTMGLRTGRFHVMVEPRYYVRSDANAFAIEGGIGFVF
jgi:hypothetical protein